MNAKKCKTKNEIETWLINWLVGKAGIPKEAIELNRPFADYALDSLTTVELGEDIEDFLHIEVPITVAWNYPTIDALSTYLSQHDNATETGFEYEDDPPFQTLLSDIENMSDKELERLLKENND
tara:strand:+ start:1234 stop:1605 length:372 start_codon:yes stop_codon:yes gene_type:complete